MDDRHNFGTEYLELELAALGEGFDETRLQAVRKALGELALRLEMAPSELLTTERGQKITRLVLTASRLSRADYDKLLDLARELRSKAEAKIN